MLCLFPSTCRFDLVIIYESYRKPSHGWATLNFEMACWCRCIGFVSPFARDWLSQLNVNRMAYSVGWQFQQTWKKPSSFHRSFPDNCKCSGCRVYIFLYHLINWFYYFNWRSCVFEFKDFSLLKIIKVLKNSFARCQENLSAIGTGMTGVLSVPNK